MEKNIFLKSIKLLEDTFDKKISKTKINIYWSRLKEYDNNKCKKAILQCIDQSEYFPTIATIKKIIDGGQEDEAELAWIELKNKIIEVGYYRSVKFEKYPAIGLVVESLGGWEYLCNMKISDETWVKKEFIKLYPILKKQEKYPEYLPGYCEIENNKKNPNIWMENITRAKEQYLESIKKGGIK